LSDKYLADIKIVARVMLYNASPQQPSVGAWEALPEENDCLSVAAFSVLEPMA
jgi:hypothetical protein